MKTKNNRSRIPELTRFFLGFLADEHMRETIIEDLEDRYAFVREKKGPFVSGIIWFSKLFFILVIFLIKSFLWRTIMFKNYLKTSLRNLKRNKGYSLINMTGLAVGMACFLLIVMWVTDELSYDRWHEQADSIYIVTYKQPNSSRFAIYGCGAIGPALQQQYPEVTHFSRRFGPVSSPLRYKDKSFSGDVNGVDPGFFDIFSLTFLKGTPGGALNDPNSLVLTESMAKKYFGSEDPVGKTMHFEWWGTWHDFRVTAVIADLPGNTHLEFDYLLPIDFVTRSGMRFETWTDIAYKNYVRLRQGSDINEVNAKISGIMREHVPDWESDVALFPTRDIHLQYSTSGAKSVTYVKIFSLVGLLILAMACINFINLSTALSAKQAREVAMRKVIGAKRTQLVYQHLGDSMLKTFIALIGSLVLIKLLLPGVNAVSGKSLALSLNGTLALQMLFLTLFVSTAAGLYPALHLSGFRPAAVITRSSTSRGGSPLFRKILVVVQFTVSILLIISSVVVLRQSTFMRSRDWGINPEYVLNMELRGGIRNNYRAVREALLRRPDVKSVCITNGSLNKRFTTDKADWEGRKPGEKLSMAIHSVDFEYDDVFGLETVEGRYFSREYSTDITEAVILNETAVHRMGMENPIGKRFNVPLPFDPDRKGRIVGIVKDFHFRSLHEPIAPLILVIAPGWFTDFYVRLDGRDLKGSMAAIEKIIKTHAPASPFDYRFLDEEIDGLYRAEIRFGKLLRSGTLLAVLIACLGLFGLALFAAEQRTKEIGIRKVLGSSTAGIVALLSKDFLLWVGIANLIAWPAAWWLMHLWLQNFAYRIPLTIWPFLLSAAAALVIAWLTVSWQSIRAATANPIDSLRYE
ncbi:MAG: ABC transporter permease [Candidatus Aminicenantes bacterium]|nr:ABC transporter permease [Candidatus Aminicenantes bacterium]